MHLMYLIYFRKNFISSFSPSFLYSEQVYSKPCFSYPCFLYILLYQLSDKRSRCLLLISGRVRSYYLPLLDIPASLRGPSVLLVLYIGFTTWRIYPHCRQFVSLVIYPFRISVYKSPPHFGQAFNCHIGLTILNDIYCSSFFRRRYSVDRWTAPSFIGLPRFFVA